MNGILKNMNYYLVKIERGDEVEFHPTLAQDEVELYDYMERGSREIGGVWKVARKLTAKEFHRLCKSE